MSQDSARFAARYWLVQLLGAVIALIAGVVVTFSPDHSPSFGLSVFAGYALVSGGVIAGTAFRAERSRFATAVTVAQGLIGVGTGLAALLILVLGASSIVTLVAVLVVWALPNAAADLTLGLRRSEASPASRDHVVIGVAAGLLAVVALLGLTDSVLVVGAFGAFAAIVGVYLAIAAFTLRWDSAPESTRKVVGS
jgi:uncharacterized membrane protein HdeD (DUF308 family)